MDTPKRAAGLIGTAAILWPIAAVLTLWGALAAADSTPYSDPAEFGVPFLLAGVVGIIALIVTGVGAHRLAVHADRSPN